MTRLRASMLWAALALLAQPVAQAGIIEDLLAIPAIQSMLGRLPELDPLLKRCEDVAYKQRNPTLCQQAMQAAQLARMPPELRAVMATPQTAVSMRELCVAVIGRPAANSYLCTELYKFDETFRLQSQRPQSPSYEDMQNRQMR